jgi:hypothetical protein
MPLDRLCERLLALVSARELLLWKPLLHTFAQHVLMNAKVAACLRYRYPALPDELHRLDLELSTELPSLHDPPPAV